MPEYIEREALIEFIKQNTPNINGETTIECVERAIRTHPAADVVEVVHGEWVETYQPLGFDEVKCAECSSCGEDWIMDDDVCIDDYKAHWKYCPCCGAKMDGKENGNNGN